MTIASESLYREAEIECYKKKSLSFIANGQNEFFKNKFVQLIQILLLSTLCRNFLSCGIDFLVTLIV